jgi:MFS family permease
MADSSLSGDVPTIDCSLNVPQEPVEALLPPTHRKGWGFQVLYGLANSVIGVGNITFYTLLLPARIALLAPTNQTNTFIVLSGIGALASILTNPVVGALSDRTTSVLGRRFPWLLIGMMLLLLSMLILAYATTLLLLGVGSVLLQIAINVLLAALSAIIPDQVPLSQRATVSAFGGMAPLAGGLIGQILVAQVIKNITISFLVLAQISSILLLVFSLVLHEQRLPKAAVAPFRLQDIPKSLWLNPKEHPDFALTWLARCLIFLASTTVVNYMFYFLQDGVHYTRVSGEPVAQGVQIFYTVYVLALLVASLICGKLSDIMQRRKIFVIGSSLLMAIGVLLFAVFPAWSTVLLGTFILGIGFGSYLSVDLALASQLLPNAQHRGKDFGLINTAIFLPMLVAPFIAGIALSHFHSYAMLFSVIAVGTVLAALLIIPIQQVQ